jgi:hypothetical protein
MEINHDLLKKKRKEINIIWSGLHQVPQADHVDQSSQYCRPG